MDTQSGVSAPPGRGRQVGESVGDSEGRSPPLAIADAERVVNNGALHADLSRTFGRPSFPGFWRSFRYDTALGRGAWTTLTGTAAAIPGARFALLATQTPAARYTLLKRHPVYGNMEGTPTAAHDTASKEGLRSESLDTLKEGGLLDCHYWCILVPPAPEQYVL